MTVRAILTSFALLCLVRTASGGDAATAASQVASPAQRSAAAAATAHGNRACTAARPFYWEIGDQHAALASGSEGTPSLNAATMMPISTASEWVFGAYVVQARAGKLSHAEVQALTMRSGYANLQHERCAQGGAASRPAETVNHCLRAPHLVGGNNSDFGRAQVDRFFYNGGHFQQLAASDPKLSALTAGALTGVIGAQLGTGTAFNYDSPQLDAGIRTTPASYAAFLRSILADQLLMHDALGANAVCTNPSRCSSAIHSPLPQTESWHYSIGHWVEDDPHVGDGAFSDPGLSGFYPWIDASRTYYGVLARESPAPGAHVGSMQCGRLIRRAWLSGISP